MTAPTRWPSVKSRRHFPPPLRFLALTLALTAWNGAAPVLSTHADHADAAPPDLHQLVLRAVELAARDAETEAQFKARYAYLDLQVTETRDTSGQLRKRTERTRAHPPAPNPGPAGADASLAESAEPDAHPAKRPYERHDFHVDAAVLERFRFHYVGAEICAGRPVWVLDFEPAEQAPPPRSLPERFLGQTAGRLWIDRAEAALVKATFRLTTPIRVVGGLVGALKRCEVALEKERTPDGLWYMRRLDWQIEGRKLFTTRQMEHRHEILLLGPRPPSSPSPSLP
ncbi:MAG: hypothetical protein M5U12_11725 [Verrucomicrobia bacterium]|nr:hypothetical protein [Verrucomicrobiota bacterium]